MRVAGSPGGRLASLRLQVLDPPAASSHDRVANLRERRRVVDRLREADGHRVAAVVERFVPGGPDLGDVRPRAVWPVGDDDGPELSASHCRARDRQRRGLRVREHDGRPQREDNQPGADQRDLEKSDSGAASRWRAGAMPGIASP